jgi:hypothetical protein
MVGIENVPKRSKKRKILAARKAGKLSSINRMKQTLKPARVAVQQRYAAGDPRAIQEGWRRPISKM